VRRCNSSKKSTVIFNKLILRCFFTQIYIPAEYISERKTEREREEEGEGERNTTTVVPYILAMVLLAAYRAGG
jgi:hypothetical protein